MIVNNRNSGREVRGVRPGLNRSGLVKSVQRLVGKKYGIDNVNNSI